tara:strand:- start:882 stop:2165 length:1284 start_codon:yes stop_codon:yes gene_type:complete
MMAAMGLTIVLIATAHFFYAQESLRAQTSIKHWRQWGGPTRNFEASDDATPLAISWPENGPRQLWSRPLGEGYSSVLVDAGMLFTMYRENDNEVVIALDPTTGATRWTFSYDAPLLNDGYFDVWLNSAGPGPYSTPVIVNDLIISIGVNGHLHALDKHTGTLRWSHNVVNLFDVVDYNAFASSPLIFEDTVILPLGGSGHGVVAFQSETGAIAWQSEPFDLGPGSPVLIDIDQQSQLLILGQQEVVGLNPNNGLRLWSHPHENELGLNISMPLWGSDNLLFLSSAYDSGSRVLRLDHSAGQTTATELWFNNRIRLHFGNALRIGDIVLGSTGDFGPAFMAALDVTTGQELWRERSFARAHLVLSDDKIVIVDEDGEVAVASVTPSGLNVYARHQLLTENAWTPPTLIGKTLFVRDRKTILAVDLGTH